MTFLPVQIQADIVGPTLLMDLDPQQSFARQIQ